MHILRPFVSLILWLFERIVPVACSLYCWIAQIQARRRGSAVSPEPMLYAYAITAVFLWHGSIFIATSNVYCLYLLNSIYTLKLCHSFFSAHHATFVFCGRKISLEERQTKSDWRRETEIPWHLSVNIQKGGRYASLFYLSYLHTFCESMCGSIIWFGNFLTLKSWIIIRPSSKSCRCSWLGKWWVLSAGFPLRQPKLAQENCG